MGGILGKKKEKKNKVKAYDPDEPPSQEEVEDPDYFAKKIKKSTYLPWTKAVTWQQDTVNTMYRKKVEKMEDDLALERGDEPPKRKREKPKTDKQHKEEEMHKLALKVAKRRYQGMEVKTVRSGKKKRHAE